MSDRKITPLNPLEQNHEIVPVHKENDRIVRYDLNLIKEETARDFSDIKTSRKLVSQEEIGDMFALKKRK